MAVFAVLVPLALATASAAAPPRTGKRANVLFVCEHGSVKSLLAKRLFEKAAADAGLDVVAESRGTDPDDAVPAWMVKALETDGLGIGDWRPSAVSEAHLRAASRVIAFDVDVPAATTAGVTVERWDGVPPVSKHYAAGRAAIKARVDALVAETKRARKDAPSRP